MTRDREIEEAIAWCVSIAVFYHNSSKTHHTEELLEYDVRCVAHWVAEAGLGEREADRRLLGPFRAELVARFGVEAGSNLCSDFLAAFREARRSEDSGPRKVPARPPEDLSALISRGPLRE